MKIRKLLGLSLLCFMALYAQLPFGSHALAAMVKPSDTQKIEMGQKLYHEGIRANGKPVVAHVKNNVPLKGKAAACVKCHLRSGYGSFEESVAVPPIVGHLLFKPRGVAIEGRERVPAFNRYMRSFIPRPAYTKKSFKTALEKGTDPAGRKLSEAMPRYELDRKDVENLVAYLNALDEPDPGVSKNEIKFATIIVEGTPQKDIDSMLHALNFHVQRKNQLAKGYKKHRYIRKLAYNRMGPVYSQLKYSLSVWVLKGPSSTWREQLEAYYKKEPVFAILSGISHGDWEPVQRFCEENHIPNILPIVDYPPLNKQDWYTLHFSHGIRQEGEASARYLHGMSKLFSGRPVVQFIRDSRKGHALAAGFRDVWKELKHDPAIDIVLDKTQSLSSKAINEIIKEKNPAAILIWDDEKALDALAKVKKEKLGLVIVSGSYLGESLWKIPEKIRDVVYITYPYRLPKDEKMFELRADLIIGTLAKEQFDRTILKKADIAADLVGRTLIRMLEEYDREYLLDMIDSTDEAPDPLYERLSFGYGQRYISKGCYIVQLTKGEKADLERRSPWVIQ